MGWFSNLLGGIKRGLENVVDTGKTIGTGVYHGVKKGIDLGKRIFEVAPKILDKIHQIPVLGHAVSSFAKTPHGQAISAGYQKLKDNVEMADELVKTGEDLYAIGEDAINKYYDAQKPAYSKAVRRVA